MKWVKHDTDANQDAKLQNVLLDYGLEGYGLYWYCIELIAGNVDKENITFELEHDARIIARNTGSTTEKVESMMKYFVDQGLFENANGVVSCLKLAQRLDKSMTSNPEMRAIIEKLKSHDSVMIKSDKVMQDKTRLEETRLEETKKETKEISEVEASDLILVKDMFSLIKLIMPKVKEPNYPSWAKEIRLMRERDGLDHQSIADVFAWANHDPFWSTNILSPKKLREHFPRLHAASIKPKQQEGKIDTGTRGRSLAQDLGDTSWAD